MKIEILDVDNPLWSNTLKRISHDVYHLPEYVALDARRTQTIPKAFLLEQEDKIFFTPYLLRSCADIDGNNEKNLYDIISPYGYPGILMNDAGAVDLKFANSALQSFFGTLQTTGICSAFLRLHPILSEKFTDYQLAPFQEDGKTISIDLTLDEAKIWAKTRKGHQSTINKCIRLGLTCRTVDFAEYMDEFIAIYEETMDRVGARDTYYFSRRYFEGLLELKDKVHLGIVESQNEIVSVCLFFESCGIVQAHLGGTKTNYLKQSPFNLLLHHMRLWAKARGNKYLHIGGGVGGKKDNLYTFKSGFSKQRHKFFTLRSIVDTQRYNNLLRKRANAVGKSIEELQSSQFFPAYRAG